MSDLFDHRLRNAARSLQPPEAPRSVIERVLSERAAGARIVLPVDDTRSTSRSGRLLALLTLAAAIATVAVTLTFRAERTPRQPSPDTADSVTSVERFFTNGGLFPTNAYAQTPPLAPGAPPVTGIDGRSLDGKQLEYGIQLVDSAGRVTPSGDGSLHITRAEYDGMPAWHVTHVAHGTTSSGQRRTQVETLFVAQRDLRLLARAVHETPYLRFSQITIRQRFVGDSVLGQMSTDNDVRRPIARELPTAFGPYISDALGPLALVGVPLSLRWRGSLSIVGWGVVPNDLLFPVTLWVVGEDRLATPGGPAECWTVRLSAGRAQRTVWVRKSDGVALKSRDEAAPTEKGRREFVLLNP